MLPVQSDKSPLGFQGEQILFPLVPFFHLYSLFLLIHSDNCDFVV